MGKLRLASPALALLIAVGVAGCGGSVGISTPPISPGIAQPSVRVVITRFAHAMGAGDGATACALLDEAGQAEIAQEASQKEYGGSLSNVQLCQEAIAGVGAQISDAERAALDGVRVGHVVVNGDTATVQPSQLSSPAGGAPLNASRSASSSPVILMLEGGQWLIDSM